MDDPYFRSLRQGQILDVQGNEDLSGQFVVVSQTCDVVQSKREFIQLAPLIELDDPVQVRGALKKENPRYPAVVAVGESRFVDLAQIFSMEKRQVLGAEICASAFSEDEFEAREFGLAVARWFGRFAFPDEVQPWLAPVQQKIREKYDSPASSFGRVLQQVSEIRVEADSWSAQPIRITLHVIIAAGRLPTVPEDAEPSTSGGLPAGLNSICDAILKEEEPLRLSLLWAAFADELAALCVPKGAMREDASVQEAVAEVVGEASSDDEFPLSRVRKSEQLDIDFLSEPAPY